MIPSGVCDLVYCGAGCLGPSRGGLDLGLSRKSNRDPPGEGGLGPWAFQKVQPTLWEGGVGPWTLQKSESKKMGGGYKVTLVLVTSSRRTRE